MKKYEKYKESGIEWVGKIPDNWNISFYKFICNVVNGFPFRSELFDSSEGKPLIRIRDITSGNIETYYKGEYSSEYVVTEGDLLVGMDGDFNVRWWNNVDALLNQRCCSIKVNENISLRFLYYLLPFDLKIINDLTYFTTVKHLSNSDISDSKLALPCFPEQTSIAKFLDHKTGQIDAIIKKKEELIVKLKEQRQAIINEAVTKGLNSNAKMKDSGIEWLGEIPEHWETCKIKHLVNLKSGDFISAENISQEGKYPVLGGNGMRGYAKDFNLDGDFVLIGRQGALCGNINYAKGEVWATEHAVVARPIQEIDVFYIGELLRFMNLNQYSESAAQPGISVGKISNLQIPKLTFLEQVEISQFIKKKIDLTQGTIDLLLEQIEKLKQYRQSLISEAVTGKIDVRDWKEPE